MRVNDGVPVTGDNLSLAPAGAQMPAGVHQGGRIRGTAPSASVTVLQVTSYTSHGLLGDGPKIRATRVACCWKSSSGCRSSNPDSSASAAPMN